MSNKHRKNRTRVTQIARDLGFELADDWAGVDAVMPLLDRMRAEGAVVLIKLDGERSEGDNGPYTAAMMGAALVDHACRIDAHFMEDAIAYIIVEYARVKWGLLDP